MLFNSLQFAIFFPIVTLLYYLLGPKARIPMLLAASCLFYMAFVPKFILILFFLILVDYTAAILIENSAGGRRRLILITSLCANVGMLAFFKYFNFFNANIAGMARMLGWNYPIEALSIVLPIGLSFHTFQSMSYTIEVYRGKFKAERSLWHFALYVLFYPQLVAGPIERPQNLLHQFHENHRLDWQNVRAGLQLMAFGLFKKIIIADRLALLVNEVYHRHQESTGPQLLLAAYFFAIQIYCDFSGYSDIARGAARVMGIELMNNFNHPFFASSLDDFWRRWHISLSTWFRDYVYHPLGGSRVARGWHCLNLFAVFVLSGLWHGANWTFIAWGALHGLGLVICVTTKNLRDSILTRLRLHGTQLARVLGTILTFNFFCLSMVFFRATDLTQALQILRRIFSDIRLPAQLHPGLSYGQFSLSLALVATLLFAELFNRHPPDWLVIARDIKWVRWVACYLFIVGSVLLALITPRETAQTFIYFQF